MMKATMSWDAHYLQIYIVSLVLKAEMKYCGSHLPNTRFWSWLVERGARAGQSSDEGSEVCHTEGGTEENARQSKVSRGSETLVPPSLPRSLTRYQRTQQALVARL